MTFSKVFAELRCSYPDEPRKVCGVLARCIIGVEGMAELEHHTQSQPCTTNFDLRPLLTITQARWILATWREYEHAHQFDHFRDKGSALPA